MKLLPKILLSLSAALFVTGAYAGTDAGRGSAKYYKTFPDKWDGKKIHMDCVSVKRINGGPQVEGVVFFSAHTIDDKNNAPGGSDRVDNARLSGILHQLERGHVYLDASGEANELILTRKEEAKNAIRFGDGIPAGGSGKEGGHYKKKKKR